MNNKHKEIFFASGNQNKWKEILHYQQQSSVKNISIKNISSIPSNIQKKFQPEEKFYTFYENAQVKAQCLYQLIQKPVISEDSGLMVRFLDDKPGVHSARLASTSKKRNSIILKKLEGVPKEHRSACFISCFCYLENYSSPIFFYGRVNGIIHNHEHGENGFGYDPIFYYPKLQKTFGEVPPSTKLEYSHRGRALRNLFLYLERQTKIK